MIMNRKWCALCAPRVLCCVFCLEVNKLCMLSLSIDELLFDSDRYIALVTQQKNGIILFDIHCFLIKLKNFTPTKVCKLPQNQLNPQHFTP